jgi:hypothetical protein
LFGWNAGFPNIRQKIFKQKLLNLLFRRMTENKKARPGWVVLILCFNTRLLRYNNTLQRTLFPQLTHEVNSGT